MKCPLCFSSANPLIVDYWHCPTCDLRFADEKLLLPPDEELARYEMHENDVHDERYRKFLEPAFDAIVARAPAGTRGLDFGAGPGPIITKQLRERGYDIEIYDPFFHPDKNALSKTYDFIFATEVVEHFHRPANEFKTLRECLAPGGFLVVMTAMFDRATDFESWYYRRDPTHTAFYSRFTFSWIARNHQFADLEFLGDRVAILTVRES